VGSVEAPVDGGGEVLQVGRRLAELGAAPDLVGKAVAGMLDGGVVVRVVAGVADVLEEAILPLPHVVLVVGAVVRVPETAAVALVVGVIERVLALGAEDRGLGVERLVAVALPGELLDAVRVPGAGQRTAVLLVGDAPAVAPAGADAAGPAGRAGVAGLGVVVEVAARLGAAIGSNHARIAVLLAPMSRGEVADHLPGLGVARRVRPGDPPQQDGVHLAVALMLIQVQHPHVAVVIEESDAVADLNAREVAGALRALLVVGLHGVGRGAVLEQIALAPVLVVPLQERGRKELMGEVELEAVRQAVIIAVNARRRLAATDLFAEVDRAVVGSGTAVGRAVGGVLRRDGGGVADAVAADVDRLRRGGGKQTGATGHEREQGEAGQTRHGSLLRFRCWGAASCRS
jgi:hypothetical protein